MNNISHQAHFGQEVQQFFCNFLMNQENASRETISSYRDTFRLFVHFLKVRKGIKASDITFERMNTETVINFLDYLEKERMNSIRTRNNRLAAIRSFMQYVSHKNPELISITERILAIPMKRYNRHLVGFLSKDEMNALLNAPDITTWNGRRDHNMFLILYNTGARVSEIISLKVQDVSLQKNGFVHIHGKGRKERTIPLWKKTIYALKKWIKELNGSAESSLFPNIRGETMSRSGVEYRLRQAAKKASIKYPSLQKKHISPHTFRHTTAMHLLQAGVDISVIALWLGHESPVTTHMYIEADLALKEKALKTIQAPHTGKFRYHPSEDLLKFLESL